MEQRDELKRASGTIGDPKDSAFKDDPLSPSASPSPATQIGRAKQTGGTSESGLEPGVESREGWPIPDQSDTPKEWPEPTID